MSIFYHNPDNSTNKLTLRDIVSNKSSRMGLKSNGVDQLLQDVSKTFGNDVQYVQHCGKGALERNLDHEVWKGRILSEGISLVAVSLNSPISFLNSVQSWRSSGLLDMIDEKIAILSNSTAIDVAIAIDFEFKIIRPKDIKTQFKLGDDIFTIASAFYYGLLYSRNDNVLFLESDFAVDLSMKPKQIFLQLLGAVGMLDRGSQVVRLMSRKGMGTYTFQDCHTQKFSLVDRKRNWYKFYCNYPGSEIEQAGNTCLRKPPFKCFTSRDSNWSLNSCMVRKSTMLGTKYNYTLSKPKKMKRNPADLSKFTKDNKTFSISIPDIGLHFANQKQVETCLQLYITYN